MNRILPTLIGALILTGCNTAKVTPRAGQWEWTTKMQIVDVKGVPEPAASMMKSATPPVQPPEQECITTAEAAKDISELMNGSKDKSCRYSDMKSSGGTFSGTAECGNPGEPMQGKGKFAGKVAPEAIDIDLDMTATMAMPGMPGNGTIQMKITRTGKRIGECPGGTK